MRAAAGPAAEPAGGEPGAAGGAPWVEPRFMERALALAERGWGRVAPNPLVGAVLVRDGEVVGEGWHAEWGGEHAEAAALREAGPRAAGATLYASLEPCVHHGKTPPCAEAVVRAGVRRVAIGARDPHAEAGGGAELLRRAGVEVATGVCGDAARLLNAAFLWFERTGEPFVALKLALSLDGRIAAAPGVRTPLTGAASVEAAHRLRAGFDAILVGIGTAAADDPRLTVRGGPPPRRPPVRVVLDTRLRLGPDSALARTAGETPTWVVTSSEAERRREEALATAGVRVLRVGPGRPEPAAALALLRERGVRSVLVEGGGRVASSFLAAGRVQRLHLLLAPRFLGEGGVPAFPAPPATPAGAWRLTGQRPVGDDAWLRYDSAALLERLAEGG